jgi:hypothetical protein
MARRGDRRSTNSCVLLGIVTHPKFAASLAAARPAAQVRVGPPGHRGRHETVRGQLIDCKSRTFADRGSLRDAPIQRPHQPEEKP